MLKQAQVVHDLGTIHVIQRTQGKGSVLHPLAIQRTRRTWRVWYQSLTQASEKYLASSIQVQGTSNYFFRYVSSSLQNNRARSCYTLELHSWYTAKQTPHVSVQASSRAETWRPFLYYLYSVVKLVHAKYSSGYRVPKSNSLFWLECLSCAQRGQEAQCRDMRTGQRPWKNGNSYE